MTKYQRFSKFNNLKVRIEKSLSYIEGTEYNAIFGFFENINNEGVEF